MELGLGTEAVVDLEAGFETEDRTAQEVVDLELGSGTEAVVGLQAGLATEVQTGLHLYLPRSHCSVLFLHTCSGLELVGPA